MGFYNRVIEESAIGSFKNIEAIECEYDNFHEGALAIVAEQEYNFGVLMQAVGEAEIKAYATTGHELVYEGARIDAFVARVKQIFEKVVARIKGLYAKVMSYIDAFFRSGESFYKKYEKQLKSAKSIKYKGYKFSIENLKEPVIPTDSSIAALGDKIEEELESIRGKVVGTGDLTSSEFSKELFKSLRNGQDSKEEIEFSPTEIIALLQNSDKIKSGAKKAMEDSEKAMKKVLADLDTTKNKTSKEKDNDEDMKSLNTKIKFYKGYVSIIQTINGAVFSATKDTLGQAKAIAGAMVRGSIGPKEEPKKDEGVKESASWDHNLEDGFLANVPII